MATVWGQNLARPHDVIHPFSHPLWKYLPNTFNPKTEELGSWHFERRFTAPHLSCVMCQISFVTCHFSPIMHNVSCAMCHLKYIYFFFTSIEARWFRVFYHMLCSLLNVLAHHLWVQFSNITLLPQFTSTQFCSFRNILPDLPQFSRDYRVLMAFLTRSLWRTDPF